MCFAICSGSLSRMSFASIVSGCCAFFLVLFIMLFISDHVFGASFLYLAKWEWKKSILANRILLFKMVLYVLRLVFIVMYLWEFGFSLFSFYTFRLGALCHHRLTANFLGGIWR